MARDLAYYYAQREALSGEISCKELELKQLNREHEKLETACKALDERHLDVVNKAKAIEKKVKSKESGANLAWRGRRKTDYDKFMDDMPVKEAKKFRKEVEEFKREINNEKKIKVKKITKIDRDLNNGFFGLYVKLRKVNNEINKLERK